MNTPVSFELAKLLKEKGFDNESAHYYNEKGEMLFDIDFPSLQPTKPDVYYDNPTISEVVMWLYEKYKIWISVDIEGENFDIFHFLVYRNHEERVKEYIKKLNDENYNTNYKTPVEAYEAAIDYALKNYI